MRSAPFFPSRVVSAGRCKNLWEPPSCELWVQAAQLKLSWFLAPSFGIGKMIDRTGMDGRILERQTDGWTDGLDGGMREGGEVEE